ncbi:protein-tyrosine-phosphatase [Entamoeba marina]
MGNKPSKQLDSEFKNEVRKVTQILPNLFLTNRTSAQDHNTFRDYNIGAVLSLTTNTANYPDGVKSKHIHIQDSFFFLIQPYLEESFKFINEMMNNNLNVLVHCEIGLSRSASAVIAYLMKTNKWTFKKAFLYVKERRPLVCPNPGFIMQLYEYQNYLGIKDTEESCTFIKDLLSDSSMLYRDIPTCSLWNSFITNKFCYEKTIKSQPRTLVVGMCNH